MLLKHRERKAGSAGVSGHRVRSGIAYRAEKEATQESIEGDGQAKCALYIQWSPWHWGVRWVPDLCACRSKFFIEWGWTRSSLTLRRKVTQRFRDFLLLELRELPEPSGQEEVPQFGHLPGSWR